jgi:hypothetical protein
MQCRGFDDFWRGWIGAILNTGRTSIMLNGVPGRWISYGSPIISL